jgi:hypothetical protein
LSATAVAANVTVAVIVAVGGGGGCEECGDGRVNVSRHCRATQREALEPMVVVNVAAAAVATTAAVV